MVWRLEHETYVIYLIIYLLDPLSILFDFYIGALGFDNRHVIYLIIYLLDPLSILFDFYIGALGFHNRHGYLPALHVSLACRRYTKLM